MQATQPFLAMINDPQHRLQTIIRDVRAAMAQGRGHLALAIAGTETSDLPGISAAGVDGTARRLTPAVDAEALVLGYPLTCDSLPRSPEGIVSPVVATRAMLGLLGCTTEVFDCGTFQSPRIPLVRVGATPGRRPDSGGALELANVEKLFASGRQHGERIALSCNYLLIAECVPGGTTTALGVLTALGHLADTMVSSSAITIDNERRNRLIREGLKKSALDPSLAARAPLRAVAAVGDPMQPFVCGLAVAAARRIPVILAGGSQMLAVYALAQALYPDLTACRLGVITTKWVAFDRSSGACKLATLVSAPFAASCPDFLQSRHAGLRAYEQGHVKEGVGLGGVLALAHLAGFDRRVIADAIDERYDLMVGSSFYPSSGEPASRRL